MLKKEILLPLLILFIFFALQYNNFQKYTQSFHFGDESEHLTPAWMMVYYNSKLYKDITTNHQPLPILTSVLFLKVNKYQNPFMFVERLRQFMFLISFLGALILVLKFRLVGLATVILIETNKFYLLGYHLLAESIVLYPVMLIVGITITHLLNNQQKNSNINQNFEVLLFGLSTFWIAFNLLPAWPFLVIANLIYLHYLKKNKQLLLIFFIILPTLLLFAILNFKDWYHFAILDNIKYFIPSDTQANSWQSYLSILLYPVKNIINPNFLISKLLLVIIFALIITKALSYISKVKNKSTLFFKFLLLYLLLVLLNLRVSKIDVGFYTAFHTLPLRGALTITMVILFANSIRLFKASFIKKLVFLSLSTLLFFTVLFFNTIWWRENVNKTNEHFLQYGNIESLGTALNVLKQKDDKLLTGELEGFLNIFAGIPTAGRQNAYLDWSFQSKESRDYLINLMASNPPTFIYFPPEGPYFNLLTPYLKNSYTQLQKDNGSKINAYILTSQINNRTTQQWKDYENLDYKIPDQAFYNNN